MFGTYETLKGDTNETQFDFCEALKTLDTRLFTCTGECHHNLKESRQLRLRRRLENRILDRISQNMRKTGRIKLGLFDAEEVHEMLWKECDYIRSSHKKMKGRKGKTQHEFKIYTFVENSPNLFNGEEIWDQPWEGIDSNGLTRKFRAICHLFKFYYDVETGDLICKVKYQVEIWIDGSRTWCLTN